jgi:hypothetical protein
MIGKLLSSKIAFRLSLAAGLVLTYLGMNGEDAVGKQPGAVFNENFAADHTALPPNTTASDFS